MMKGKYFLIGLLTLALGSCAQDDAQPKQLTDIPRLGTPVYYPPVSKEQAAASDVGAACPINWPNWPDIKIPWPVNGKWPWPCPPPPEGWPWPWPTPQPKPPAPDPTPPAPPAPDPTPPAPPAPDPTPPVPPAPDPTPPVPPAPDPTPPAPPAPDPTPPGKGMPKAAFNVLRQGLMVTFTDQSTDDQGVKSWQWDFGNGQTSQEKNPTTHYRSKATYEIKLTVTDGDGNSNSVSKSIEVAKRIKDGPKQPSKPPRPKPPTPKPPRPKPPAPKPPQDDFAREILNLVNASRASGANCGGQSMPAVGALTYNNKLAQAAQSHSQDMAARNYFNHRSPDGRGPGARIKATGYRAYTWAENIAAGVADPKAVHKMWMDSAGHCRNVMNGRLKEMGIGYAKGSAYRYRHLWTQVFGTSR